MPRSHCVYRHYDAEDQLLYVGRSVNLHSRTKTHGRNSHWWLEVVKITVEHYDTLAEAERAEGNAIFHEKPLHNKMRNLWQPTDEEAEAYFAARRSKAR